MKWALIVTITLIMAVIIPEVQAHSGGLNSYGCHHDYKRGGYHCHEEEEDEFTKEDSAALVALVGGLIVLKLLADKGAFHLHLTPHFNDEKEIGLVAEYIAEGPHRMGVKMYTDDRQNTYTGIHWRFDF